MVYDFMQPIFLVNFLIKVAQNYSRVKINWGLYGRLSYICPPFMSGESWFNCLLTLTMWFFHFTCITQVISGHVQENLMIYSSFECFKYLLIERLRKSFTLKQGYRFNLLCNFITWRICTEIRDFWSFFDRKKSLSRL